MDNKLNFLTSNQWEYINMFTSIVNSGRLHNAYIISGKEGIGKYNASLYLSKLLLSYEINDLKDNQNLQVNSKISNIIDNNNHPNLLVVKPDYDIKTQKQKSVLDISKIRYIQTYLNKASDELRYKIIIIETADLLNINAANSLLKSLEEPPKNTIFLILANNYNCLLDTIKSRCINIKMNPLSFEDIMNILDKEGILLEEKYQKDVINLINYSYSNIHLLKSTVFIELLEDINGVFEGKIKSYKEILVISEKIKKINISDNVIDFIIELLKYNIYKKYMKESSEKWLVLMHEITKISNEMKVLFLDYNLVILNILFKVKKNA